MPMPFAPGAIREFLLASDEVLALVPAGNITTRDLPKVIEAPFITLRAPGNVGVDPMLRRPMVQVDVWSPKIEILGGTTDPEELSWNIAALAGELIGRARMQSFRNSTWKAQWTDGPITFVDTQRGADLPLYRATIRVELKMTVR
ncbi:hypothetical protein BO226_17465 [Rhodococcus sp. 2G]|uniref:hypothetical protein n=1 Tax=unclassified Rhodococcus (in: high G+C Gram-positive bacteria) TaxID=192944 RepID=UPI0007D90026|nr:MULTISPECIES: hypothetical protein [unclassified Rhodococcus (in: high G+C Gram-positive bacteria)]APE10763.1 hypothetical protein BO226_17465 [Rhodococcus sp. 2G]